MSEALKVQKRDSHGKRNNRRLRRAGNIPAVLYGHHEKTLSLAVSAEQLAAVLRHGQRVVDLEGRGQGKGLHPRAAMGPVRRPRAARRFHPRLGR